MIRAGDPVTRELVDWIAHVERELARVRGMRGSGAIAIDQDAGGPVIHSTGSGKLLGVQYLTAASGTYTPTAGTASIFVELIGGGGGGGGVSVTNDATEGAVGGGGSAGTYTALYIGTPAASYTYAAGAAGTGGAINGGNGGSTTFNGGSVTAPGGPGGSGNTQTTTLQRTAGGAHSTAGVNGDVSIQGQAGGIGWIIVAAAPVIYAGGFGGSTILGSGGRSTDNNPSAGLGYGAGGGGAVLNVSGTGIANSIAGGAGAAGVIRVWEFG